ncbi:MAG TPA: ABC transporter permease [Thermoanaerobaculia bacterium]|jgi:ABC-type antimicrobial peptide transport system permease subunit|nr:ABC transporter permease [Thermoanaerobaculia bacterium]
MYCRLVRALEITKQGLRHLAAHRFRTTLALLGIVVGVAAVVGSISLMDGVERMLRETFERLGGPRIGIARTQWGSFAGGRWIPFSKVYEMTDEDRRALPEAIPEIEEVCSSSFGTATIASERLEMPGVFVVGNDANWLRIRPFPLVYGRYFSPEEARRGERVAVVFRPLAEDLLGKSDPLGEEIRIDGQRFIVIGVLGTIGNGPRTDWRRIFVPFEAAAQRLGRPRNQAVSWFKVRPGTDTKALTAALSRVLVARHPGSKKENFFIRAFAQFQDDELKSLKARGSILIAVAVLCLVAGGVGVMNVFLVTVTERTAEIGLRMALGASKRSVLSQFLIEALVLCFFGGAVGLALGQGLAVGFAEVVKQRMTSGAAEPELLSVSVGAKGVLLAVVLSSVVAALFGSLPAIRAARLDPATSLRHE